jgi:drug/metabolite transporter (DMT)-like permease
MPKTRTRFLRIGHLRKSIQNWPGVIEVMLAGIGFGFLGIFARLGHNQNLSIGELLTWRFALASTMLWVYAILFNRDLIKIQRQQFVISCCLGFFGYAVFSSLYFFSIQGVSVALAAILLFTFPIFVNLGAHFVLKQTLQAHQWWALLISTFGVVILLWGDLHVQSLWSIAAGLGAALTYGIYVLVSGETQKNIQPLSSSLYVISAAALGLALFHRPSPEVALQYSSNQALIVLGLAVVCTIGPLTLFLLGLQKMPSSQAAIIVMVEPVTAALVAWWLLGEALLPLQLLGGVLVLLGMYLSPKKQKPDSSASH